MALLFFLILFSFIFLRMSAMLFHRVFLSSVPPFHIPSFSFLLHLFSFKLSYFFINLTTLFPPYLFRHPLFLSNESSLPLCLPSLLPPLPSFLSHHFLLVSFHHRILLSFSPVTCTILLSYQSFPPHPLHHPFHSYYFSCSSLFLVRHLLPPSPTARATHAGVP